MIPGFAILLSDANMMEERILRLLDRAKARGEFDQRWVAIALTHIEQGFMALNRASYPGDERMILPEDVGEGGKDEDAVEAETVEDWDRPPPGGWTKGGATLTRDPALDITRAVSIEGDDDNSTITGIDAAFDETKPIRPTTGLLPARLATFPKVKVDGN